MKAKHGFSIVERRDGLRIRHYARRPANDFEVAKYRIICLARDIRLKHLSERTFEVWDGIDAVCKMVVFSSGEYRVIPYLLPTVAHLLDKDREIVLRRKVKSQRVGNDCGDLTSWIKEKPMDRELLTKISKDTWTEQKKTTSRRLGV
jgi:hypothetical protein